MSENTEQPAMMPHGEPLEAKKAASPASAPPLQQRIAAASGILDRFRLLPARYAGRDVVVRFSPCACFERVPEVGCVALKMEGEIGNMIQGEALLFLTAREEPWEELNDSPHFTIFARGRTADQILSMAEGETILARARTVFGVAEILDEWDEERVRLEAYFGLLVTKLLRS